MPAETTRRLRALGPWQRCLAFWLASWIGCWLGSEAAELDRTPQAVIRRAEVYLLREVAAWEPEHHCYSCHNHGDGARALLAAASWGRDQRQVTELLAPLQPSLRWLHEPRNWDRNGPDGPFSDRKLARIQFAATLGEAVRRGQVPNATGLQEAAEQLVREQLPDGSWDYVGADALGAATTYGRALATVMARDAVATAEQERHRSALERAAQWIRNREAHSTVDAAAILWGLRADREPAAETRRRQCRAVLEQGQAEEGGWGPYVTSAPEPFDTALAILALATLPDASARERVARGQQFLRLQQLSDGSWVETTRPLPRESYSQRLSTTAWATLALLAESPPLRNSP